MDVKEKSKSGGFSEYDLTALTEWPVEEWEEKYPKIKDYMSELIMTQKREYTELLPLIQLLTPMPVKERIRHLSIDGEHLYYSPVHINKLLDKHGEDRVRNTLLMQFMHILMHDFLGQFGACYEDEELAWAIMDLLSVRFSRVYLDPARAVNPEAMDIKNRWGDRISEENMKKLDKLLDKGMGAYHVIKPMEKSKQFIKLKGKPARSDNHRLWRPENKEKWEQAVQDRYRLFL